MVFKGKPLKRLTEPNISRQHRGVNETHRVTQVTKLLPQVIFPSFNDQIPTGSGFRGRADELAGFRNRLFGTQKAALRS